MLNTFVVLPVRMTSIGSQMDILSVEKHVNN